MRTVSPDRPGKPVNIASTQVRHHAVQLTGPRHGLRPAVEHVRARSLIVDLHVELGREDGVAVDVVESRPERPGILETEGECRPAKAAVAREEAPLAEKGRAAEAEAAKPADPRQSRWTARAHAHHRCHSRREPAGRRWRCRRRGDSPPAPADDRPNRRRTGTPDHPAQASAAPRRRSDPGGSAAAGNGSRPSGRAWRSRPAPAPRPARSNRAVGGWWNDGTWRTPEQHWSTWLAKCPIRREQKLNKAGAVVSAVHPSATPSRCKPPPASGRPAPAPVPLPPPMRRRSPPRLGAMPRNGRGSAIGWPPAARPGAA